MANTRTLNKTSICVTGATGFLGQRLVDRLLTHGANVSILAQARSDSAVIESFRIRGVRVTLGDICCGRSVAQALQHCEFVVHLAGKDPQARGENDACFRVNVQGTRNLLEQCAAAGIQRVVHCSTISVHGHIEKPPASEEEPYRPRGAYEVSKCEGEKIAKQFFSQRKPPGVILRSGMIWGAGDARALNLFRGVSKRKIAAIGNGRQFTHWVHVEDLVTAFVLALVSPTAEGETYIIAGRNPINVSDLIALIAANAGVPTLPFKIPATAARIAAAVISLPSLLLGRPAPVFKRKVDWFSKSRAFDITKARIELGFEPSKSVAEEIQEIYQWYRGQRLLD